MAYIPGQKLGEDEEQQLGSGGGPSVSAPSVGGVANAGDSPVGSSPVAQSGTTAGTGFVNIDRVIGANKGAAQGAKQRADQALARDATNFGTAATNANQSIDAEAGKIIKDPNSLVSNVVNAPTSGKNPTTGLTKSKIEVMTEAVNTGQDPLQAWAAYQAQQGMTGNDTAGLQEKAIKAAQDALGQTYQGATTVEHDIGNTQDIKKAQNFGNAQTAGSQIAQDNGTTGQYGTGLQAIDRAIYGSAQEKGTMDQIGSTIGAQTSNQQLGKSAIEQRAKDTATQLGQSIADTRNAFQTKAGEIGSSAQSRADAVNAEETRRQSNKPEDKTINSYMSPDEIEQTYAGAFLKEGEGEPLNPGHRAAIDSMTKEQRAVYDQIKQLYPNMRRGFAISLAKDPRGLGALQKTRSGESTWVPGAGPAQASSFVDAGALQAIGAVLGDAGLMGTQKGPEFQGGHWEQNNVWDLPSGSPGFAPAAEGLPEGYAMDANGNLTVAPGYEIGPGGVVRKKEVYTKGAPFVPW